MRPPDIGSNVEIIFAISVGAIRPGRAATSMSMDVVCGTSIAVEIHASQRGTATGTS